MFDKEPKMWGGQAGARQPSGRSLCECTGEASDDIPEKDHTPEIRLTPDTCSGLLRRTLMCHRLVLAGSSKRRMFSAFCMRPQGSRPGKANSNPYDMLRIVGPVSYQNGCFRLALFLIWTFRRAQSCKPTLTSRWMMRRRCRCCKACNSPNRSDLSPT